MQVNNILIPLNHYKGNTSIYNQQTEIQILNSDTLNELINIDEVTQEELYEKDYLKLISDNEINRFFSYQKREKYFSQPYLCIPVKFIKQVNKNKLFFITHALFAFIRLYDSIFGKDEEKSFFGESWGEWCCAPGYYNTICLYQVNGIFFCFDLIIDKPFLRLKCNILSETSDIYKYLIKLPETLLKDNFLTNILCTYNNLYSLIIEENFDDFILLGVSVLENIFPTMNLEKSEDLANQVANNIIVDNISKAQVYNTIKDLYKRRNTLVHYYQVPKTSTEFFSKAYEFRAIDVFKQYKNLIYKQEQLLMSIIENYIFEYIKKRT